MRMTHTVLVQKRRTTTTAHGRALEDYDEPIALRCRFRRMNSGEVNLDGTVVEYDARLLIRDDWPAGPLDNKAQVTADGLVYDMHGVPVRRDGSPRTQHWQINLEFVGRDHG